MPHRTRREFVRTSAAAALTLLGPRVAAFTPRRSLLADSRIDVLLDEPIGTIAPEIYGHFLEHLGGVIYDGVWVGEGSRVPNSGGIRQALIDALKPIRPSVVRWPGGCFADSYDWRDGIGPRDKRPHRPSFWADDPAIRNLGNIPQRYEPNQFGTHEFMRFCRLVGAQPYLAVNLRILPAKSFMDWLDYVNAPAGTTTLADQRAANGDRDPFGVRFWGVGNESWGCGGNFTPEEYSAEFRRFTTWAVPSYGVNLAFIGSGPSGGDLEWTRRCFREMAERRGFDRLWGWALHHYSSAPNGEAVAFDNTAWYDLLASANRMESLITAQWQAMGESDREHRVKLVVDEWGAWHKMTTNVDPTHLFGQQSTMRDALVAGLTLDTFNRHADKVAMANIAQMINCIQSLFLAHEDRFVLTPTYHVFQMYAAHQGAKSARTVVSAPPVIWADGQQRSHTLWGLNGSASVNGRAIVLTVTNPHLAEPRDAEIAIRGATVTSGMATTLAAHDVHDHNTFEAPKAVAPTTAPVAVGAPLVYRFPAASVTRLELRTA